MFTEGLAHFICNTNYEDLAPEIITKAKAAILDYIGVAMAGSQEPSGRMIGELVREYQSTPEATVIGGRFKSSCAVAALANGTASHVQDYDDCLDYPTAGLAHPTTGVFSGILAVGEKSHLPGRDLITAYCLGVEAYGKIGLLPGAGVGSNRGWEWTGVLGVMGSVAAISKLLKLNEYQTMMGFGIAATTACSLIRNFGSMAGHLHGGNAARNGIEAALLAQKGYTATYPGIIEGPGGFYNAFTSHPDPVPEKIQQERLDSLANPWSLISPGLMFKSYPCAHLSHFGVYGALQLRQEHSIDWQQIEEIEFRIPHILERMSTTPAPQNGVQGRFNLAYCLCRALIHGEIDFGFFTDEAVKDPITRQLMSKVRWVVVHQESLVGPFGYQEIVLKMKDGNIYRRKVEHPRGEPQKPQTEEELADKFRKCALYARYDEKTISKIKAMVTDLDNVADISQLTELLV
jgi:2-methylcitrate dehydratase PrpD